MEEGLVHTCRVEEVWRGVVHTWRWVAVWLPPASLSAGRWSISATLLLGELCSHHHHPVNI